MSTYNPKYYNEDWKARNKAWHEAHPNWRKEYREANKEKLNAKSREYCKNNPDIMQRKVATRRARKRDAFVEVVSRDVVFERDNGVCQICHKPVEVSYHIDHIIPLVAGGEHSYANVQLTHPHCNMSKGAKVLG